MLRRAGLRANLTRVVSRPVAAATARANSSLPPSYEMFPPAPRPEGVEDTWQASHIDSDQGFFEDDVFPPALPGETLEEYCRRVPNIWSPCSRSTDVVDVRVSTTLEFSQDINMEDHQFSERPLIKIPPLDSDWHAANEMEVRLANPPDPYTVNGTVPAEIHPEEAEEVSKIIMEGAQRVGYGHWFEADNFYDFWIELTGKKVTEMPFEKTMDRLLELNPGMTHLEIEKRFVPGVGKDEWFLGGNPRMSEEDIKIAKESAKIAEETEGKFQEQMKLAQKAFDKHIDEAVKSGEKAELRDLLQTLIYFNEDGQPRLKPEEEVPVATQERLNVLIKEAFYEGPNSFGSFMEKYVDNCKRVEAKPEPKKVE